MKNGIDVNNAEDGSREKNKEGKNKTKNIKITKQMLDAMWSKLIRKKFKVCAIDGCNNPRIFAHHIFSRKFNNTRYNIDNGIGLCYVHHIHFAHVDYEGFREFVVNKIGHDLFKFLYSESRQMLKLTKDVVEEKYKMLKEKLDEFT